MGCHLYSRGRHGDWSHGDWTCDRFLKNAKLKKPEVDASSVALTLSVLDNKRCARPDLNFQVLLLTPNPLRL